MRIVKNFKDFLINEDLEQNNEPIIHDHHDLEIQDGIVTLYRLTSHHVVNLAEPGEYYVRTLDDVNPDFLDNKEGDEYWIITVKCPESNIDDDNTEIECAKHNCDCIVAVKDDAACEMVSVEPWNKIN